MNQLVKVYVPRDSSALSLGANRTAKAIQAEADKRGLKIELIRSDFYKRFQPKQTARAVTNQLNFNTALLRFSLNRFCGAVCA